MTDRQVKLVQALVYVTFAVAYLAVVGSIAMPDLRLRGERALQWARYYHWVRTRLPVPRWVGALQREDLPDEVTL